MEEWRERPGPDDWNPGGRRPARCSEQLLTVPGEHSARRQDEPKLSSELEARARVLGNVHERQLLVRREVVYGKGSSSDMDDR